MPKAQLLYFPHESEALSHVWRILRAHQKPGWPRLVDLSLHRVDGSEVSFEELQSWAEFPTSRRR